MGVATRVVVYAPSREAGREGAAAAFGRIGELEHVMSDYRADSEAMLLCAAGAGREVVVSDDLWRVLAVSQELSGATEGAFDVTAGPASALWREMRKTGRMATEERMASARARVGFALVHMDAGRRTVMLEREGMVLDFGGIGKGFAAQEAVDLLRSRGLGSCLVALAGDVVAGDAPPGERGWVVETGGGARVRLENAAISTSGDAEQWIEIADAGGERRRFAHIVDARTGLGVETAREVTVLAPRGELADALATAASVAGVEAVAGVIERYGGRVVGPTAAR